MLERSIVFNRHILGTCARVYKYEAISASLHCNKLAGGMERDGRETRRAAGVVRGFPLFYSKFRLNGFHSFILIVYIYNVVSLPTRRATWTEDYHTNV